MAAIVTKHGIRVYSYVHTEQGLVEFDELTPEQKKRAATELKIRYMNDLYRGKATFTVAEDTSTTFPPPGETRGDANTVVEETP